MILRHLEALERQALARAGVHDRFTEVGGVRLHYYESECPYVHDEDARPTVFVMHGLGASAISFFALLRRLHRAGFRVVAPDAPGHGLSGALQGPHTAPKLYDALAAFFARDPAPKALFVGNSLGGAIALRYAIDHPARVRGVVASSPAGAPLDAADMAALRETFHLKGARDVMGFMAKLMHRPSRWSRFIAGDLALRFARAPVQEILQGAGPGDFFAAEDVASLAVPVMILWGRSDRILPRANLEFFLEHLPAHGQVVELDAIGHSPHLERPRELARLIVDFSRQVS